MISAYCLNKSPEDSGLSVKKQNKIRRIKFLIIVAIVVLGGVTIQRHKLSGTIFASILNVVAGYFCCGPGSFASNDERSGGIRNIRLALGTINI